MASLPWFKVYAAETLSDERFQGWTVDERGAWFSLLCIAWREGSIPGDSGSLARLLHVDGSAMRLLWSAIGDRFIPHPDFPGRLTSPRLEMERESAERLREKKSAAGKKGATSRWETEKRKHSSRMRVPSDQGATSKANDNAEGKAGQVRAAAAQPAAADESPGPEEETGPAESDPVKANAGGGGKGPAARDGGDAAAAGIAAEPRGAAGPAHSPDDAPPREPLEVVDESGPHEGAGPFPLTDEFRLRLMEACARTALYPVGGGREVFEACEGALERIPVAEAVRICRQRVLDAVARRERQPGTLKFFVECVLGDELTRRASQPKGRPRLSRVDENGQPVWEEA